MMRNGLLTIGCASMFIISGCVADSPAGDPGQTQVATAELAATPGITVHSNGDFHNIEFVYNNMPYCMQPLGGSTDDVPVELQPCGDGTQLAMNWIFVPTAHGTKIVNENSGKCLYNEAPVPLFDFAKPIMQESCNASGTSNPASNALWTPSTGIAGTTFQSRVQFRDTGFCLDVFQAVAGQGTQFENYHCLGNSNHSGQTFFIN